MMYINSEQEDNLPCRDETPHKDTKRFIAATVLQLKSSVGVEGNTTSLSAPIRVRIDEHPDAEHSEFLLRVIDGLGRVIIKTTLPLERALDTHDVICALLDRATYMGVLYAADIDLLKLREKEEQEANGLCSEK